MGASTLAPTTVTPNRARSAFTRAAAAAATPSTRRAGLFLLASTAAGLLNDLYQLAMGRLLGPAGYGAFASLLALLLIVSMPASVLQTVVTNLVARLRACADLTALGPLLARWWRLLAASAARALEHRGHAVNPPHHL